MNQYTEDELRKAYDKVIAEVFVDKKHAFLSALMCNMELKWDTAIPTACTNGKYIKWSPDFFMKMPHKTRVSIQFHELWHVARLHMLRRGKRDPRIWNYACDIRINNDLLSMGYGFDGVSPWLDSSIPLDIPEEDIYDKLIKDAIEIPFSDLDGDMSDAGDVDPSEIIEIVVRAHQTATLIGKGGLPGDALYWLNKFLAPKINWEEELSQWATDLVKDDYSFRRPSRRYDEIIMPSLAESENRLEKLHYYPDVSASITTDMIIRINSELKYIKETLNPKQLSIFMFDTELKDEILFAEGDSFERIKIVGGGGTCLKCVKQHIEETQPTAAIILSDMFCDPMQELENPIPVLWVVINNPDVEIPFGRAIHIEE